jgi:hypothetical protein
MYGTKYLMGWVGGSSVIAMSEAALYATSEFSANLVNFKRGTGTDTLSDYKCQRCNTQVPST